jgi:hypothetical protein
MKKNQKNLWKWKDKFLGGIKQMLMKHEIIGSEKPIIFEKKANHYTYDEIVYIGENPEKYIHVGFMPIYVGDNQMFEKLYVKGE